MNQLSPDRFRICQTCRQVFYLDCRRTDPKRLPSHESLLIEQLESVQVVESRIGKRDTLKCAPSGVGPSAGLHDDHVVALALGLVVLEPRVGKLVMDPMPHGCNLRG